MNKDRIRIKEKGTGKIIFSIILPQNNMKKTLAEAVKQKVNLSGASFSYADLSGLNLSNIDLTECDFRCCKLQNVNFSESNLARADFFGSILENVNFRRSILKYADLTQTNCIGAQFDYAKLSNCDLRDAIIDSPIFRLDIGQVSISFNGYELQIGELDYPLEKWEISLDQNILPEPYDLFWRRYRDAIKSIIDSRFEKIPVIQINHKLAA